MHVQLWQTLLVVFYGFFINYDKEGPKFGTAQPVVAGFLTGLIMGDVTTGLYIGGTLQLMTLGITSFGGASVPDYQTAALIGTYLSVSTKQDASIGITLAIPVAMLIVQLDVLKWSTNIYFQQKAEKYAEKEQYRKLELMQYLATINTSFVSGLPVLFTVLVGPKIVGSIIKYIPLWITNGLKVAGGILPAVGIGMLLKYLPTKDYFAYLLVGFVLAVYLKVPILGISLLGAAIALITYKNSNKSSNLNIEAGGADEDE
ncbi:PTS sugar transporter subunit IIC [Bombilactobacillus bombi]|uniref:PTS mannose/fructose/sorbose/N-acetylgalactosamine transporter subunit IIC n=1 Tax=Bombilactobacillus bombi TaxID=1303590 RepID=UPI000E56D7E8|nr:PTS sugar transporter subunit IIC [Bombilactobacillus bombi]AXX65084.1 PTS sugar transporter subunit IIC [Bombilactobacillus bombi]